MSQEIKSECSGCGQHIACEAEHAGAVIACRLNLLLGVPLDVFMSRILARATLVTIVRFISLPHLVASPIRISLNAL